MKDGGHLVFNKQLTFTIARYPSHRIVKFGVRSTTAVELMGVMLQLGRRSVRRSAPVCHASIASSRSPLAAPACFSSSGRDSRQLPRVVSEQTLFENPWIRLKRILFLDAKGSERHWTGLERTTTYPKPSSDAVADSAQEQQEQEQDKQEQEQEVCDAVVVFPFLTKPGAPTRVVLIRQFRPPVGQWVLELPAGLIDAQEAPEVAAMRELKEETGYVGSRVLHMGPPMVNDQGVTNGKCRLLLVEVRDEEQQSPRQQQLEPDEIIHVVHAPLEGLVHWLEARKLREKDAIDARLYSYALGLHALPSGLGGL